MMKQATVALLVTGFLVLVGCSQADPPPTMVAEATAVPPTATASQVEEIVEPTPEIEVIDSVKEFAGTWKWGSTLFRRFFEDGTSVHGSSLEELDRNAAAGEFQPQEFWFEDGLFHVTDERCAEVEGVTEAGVYQIQRVDDERIRFVEIDEPCWYRGVRLYRETATMTRVDVTREVEVEVTREVEAEVSDTPAPARTVEEKMANAMSAAPAPIAADATILDYPEEGRGNWPDEPAPELVELRAGSNSWTCIVDIPDTPGNDPMCLNEVYLEVLMSTYNLVDAPSTGVGFGYMLQGGGPVGSPPHMMVFVPESNASFNAFGTEPGPFPWIMFPETSQQHLMVLVTPPEEAVAVDEDKMANAMSAGPAPIAGDATLLDYPEEWPANWPEAVAPELIEMRPGSNGWTCIVDRPDTPGNDPMCLNDVYLEVLMSTYNLVDAPSTGVGFGYMLQGGGPVGSPPHMMVFVPESNASFNAFGIEPGPFPWIMFPETSQQHLMVLTR